MYLSTFLYSFCIFTFLAPEDPKYEIQAYLCFVCRRQQNHVCLVDWYQDGQGLYCALRGQSCIDVHKKKHQDIGICSLMDSSPTRNFLDSTFCPTRSDISLIVLWFPTVRHYFYIMFDRKKDG